MSILSDHVQITITQNSTGISRAGFGTALILSVNASFSERYRTYSSLLDVAADFADTTSPEYQAARAAFSQSPHPEQVAIGRGSNKPTLQYVIGVNTVRNSHAYKLNVVGQGVTTTAITSTSDSSATNDEIIADIVSLLNGVSGKNYTAAATGAGGSHVATVTATNPGDWFSLDIADPADLSNAISHTDPGIATDLDAISLENSDWYALITLYNSTAYVEAAAAWIEAQNKIYIVDVPHTASVTAVVTGGDVLDALHSSAYSRTAGAYHPRQASFMAASWCGRLLPLDPGSETWKFKTLAGVIPVKLTGTHRTNLRAKKANTVETIAGRSITWEGTVANGNFIDVTRGLDWLEDDMTKAVFGALAGASKIPYTNQGVALIENEVRGSLGRAVARGILSDNPAPTVDAPLVADIDASNKGLRILPDLEFAGTLAGAIHHVKLVGVVSV